MVITTAMFCVRHLLPATRSSSGEFFTFQQDSAPAHHARETIEMLSHETPDFISPLQWPPNSPDLNPIWVQLQERIYCTRIQDTDHLVERLVEEWSRCDHEIISAAVTQWRARLCACVKADGGHFEHFL